MDYRQGVNALVIKDKKLLMVFKKNSKLWDLPGGGIDEGETPEQCLLRELKEELGTDKFEIVHKSDIKEKYDWPESEREKNFKKSGKWVAGQEKYYFIVQFTGTDKDLKLQEAELESFKWFSTDALDENLAYKDQLSNIKTILADYDKKQDTY